MKKLLRNQYIIYSIFLASLLVTNVMLCFTEHYPATTVLAALMIPAGIYGAMLASTRKPGVMMLVALPIMIFNAFQIVLLYLFGNSIIAVDMFTNLYTTTISEAGELLDNIMPAVIGVCVLYIPMILLSVRSILMQEVMSTYFRRYAILISLGVAVVGFLIGGISRITRGDFKVKYDVFPINAIYNLTVSLDRWQRSFDYPKTSAEFKFDARKGRRSAKREIYVMVIGEASRAANWSLYGYERPTTPHMQADTGVVAFSDALTQNNATHKSVPIIMSAASAENFEDIYTTKSFITAFKEAGFRTLFISNQAPNRSFIDYFSEEADQLIRLDSVSGGASRINHFDDEMLPIIRRSIDADSRNLLIVLHTYGSHYNFRHRYPESQAPFQPDLATTIDRANRQAVVNSYDNSVHYTDKFLADIIAMINSERICSALLYVSDHGEDLMDDERNRFLHASPTTTYYQLHIAYLGWFSEGYRNAFADKFQAAQLNRDKPTSTATVFHTLLDLADIRTQWLNRKRSMVSADFQDDPQLYLNDHYRAVPYQQTGLTELDYRFTVLKRPNN